MNDAPLRPRSHIVGDVGQTTVSLQFKKWGWTSDIVESDYGEDLYCEVFVDNRRTALNFRCQVKSYYSNKGQVRKLRSGCFSISIARSVCSIWAKSYFPIVLAVYDEQEDVVYWSDISHQVREKVTSSVNESISLIIKNNDLRSTKSLLESQVCDFYSKLLSISEPMFSCTLYPVLMPQHRTLNFQEIHSIIKHEEKSGMIFETIRQSYELLPSWITSVECTFDNFLYGVEVISSHNSIDEFIDKLKRELLTISLDIEEGSWLTFIVSPIVLKEKNDSETVNSNVWGKQLTEWSSYNIISKNCFLDADYAFRVPNDFKRQIGRRSRSWDGQYFVSTTLDIAVQVLSEQNTTPALRESNARFKQQVIGKFVPWVCQRDKIVDLQEQLNEYNLVFVEVSDKTISTESNCINGIISVPHFNPELGLLSITDDWKKFKDGEVRYQLSQFDLLSKLYGYEGSEQITEFVLSFFDSISNDFPEQTLVYENEHVVGMPLHQDKREIIFQKLIQVNEIPSEQVLSQLEIDLKNSIDIQIGSKLSNSKLKVDLIDYGFSFVVFIALSYIPNINESTFVVLEKYKDEISKLLNSSTLKISDVPSNSMTEYILKIFGEIYFEEDALL